MWWICSHVRKMTLVGTGDGGTRIVIQLNERGLLLEKGCSGITLLGRVECRERHHSYGRVAPAWVVVLDNCVRSVCPSLCTAVVACCSCEFLHSWMVQKLLQFYKDPWCRVCHLESVY